MYMGQICRDKCAKYVFLGGVAHGWSRVLSTSTLPYICEISQAEAYRIDQENRDFSKYILYMYHQPALYKLDNIGIIISKLTRKIETSGSTYNIKLYCIRQISQG